MKNIENWKVESAEWSSVSPYTLTVKFINPHDSREAITSTMSADKWQSAQTIAWELRQERDLTGKLGKRLNDALEENLQLKIDLLTRSKDSEA